ncbi:SH3-like domain-containing protein [Streptosporangium soli]
MSGRSDAFAVGNRVRVKVSNSAGHHRAPRYVHGRCGRIESYVGRFGLPDDLAEPGRPVRTDRLFTVCFRAEALWGADGHPSDSVYVDLYSLYLEPA